MRTALFTAGAYSGAGAGIQAEFHEMTMNGVSVRSAVSAQTMWNTAGVTILLERNQKS